MLSIANQFISEIESCDKFIDGYLSNKSMSTKKESAFYLGYTLGMFLAIVEYGITSRIVIDYDADIYKPLEQIMFAMTGHIRQRLKELNKSVKHNLLEIG